MTIFEMTIYVKKTPRCIGNDTCQYKCSIHVKDRKIMARHEMQKYKGKGFR